MLYVTFAFALGVMFVGAAYFTLSEFRKKVEGGNWGTRISGLAGVGVLGISVGILALDAHHTLYQLEGVPLHESDLENGVLYRVQKSIEPPMELYWLRGYTSGRRFQEKIYHLPAGLPKQFIAQTHDDRIEYHEVLEAPPTRKLASQ